MTGKQYLQQIREIDTKVRILREEIEIIKAKLGYQSPSFDSVGGHPKNTYVEDNTVRLLFRLSEKEKELSEELIKLEEKKAEIKAVLFQLDNPVEIEVLYRRYFKLEKWDEIAEGMNYSRMQIARINTDGMYHLEKMLQNVTF